VLRAQSLLRFLALPLAAATLGWAQQQPSPPSSRDQAQPEDVLKKPLYQSIVITAAPPIEPTLDRRNDVVFRQTLFTRDDQVFQFLAAGIDAGQHEGGGKSIEVRRFGFNLDHGGVNGGLKVLVDDVQQNQTTQGHGQGYLGSLKSLSPELVREVEIVNGPFSAEYGDFSGLGVVHIKLRESLPDEWTLRLQGGSFGTSRGFLSYSPNLKNGDGFIAYEGSRTAGPFQSPLRYIRNNLTANLTRRLDQRRAVGLKFNGGVLGFDSSGQIPLDRVAAGLLDPYGFIDPTNGGRSRAGTAAVYYRDTRDDGAVFRLDGFVTRSLYDLYSNFTFYLNDPVNGDAFQQHDSRLIEGANAQYLRPYRFASGTGLFTSGANFHANQINVGLYPHRGRIPTGVTTRADAGVTNTAGYLQNTLSWFGGKLQAGAGLRYDLFHFNVRDRVSPDAGGTDVAGRVQPKLSFAFTPSARLPVTFYVNYGRGISSADARGVVADPHGTRVATTDFYQLGTSHHLGRVSVTTDLFWIDRSNELVYVADDGSLEFAGPTRAYGFETKTSVELSHHLSFNAGITKVANAFYRGASPREYVDRAPHFVSDAALTLAGWRGWSGSLRMRAINHYRLDPLQPVTGAGHTVFDLSLSRRIRRGVEFNLAIDNFTDRLYYETQNWFESRLPGEDPAWRIHATPGYPLTVMAGLTFRLKGK
jgi:outer membrane receptor protein involved in Fe transport